MAIDHKSQSEKVKNAMPGYSISYHSGGELPDKDKEGRNRIIQEGSLKGQPNMFYEYPNNEDKNAVAAALGKK